VIEAKMSNHPGHQPAIGTRFHHRLLDECELVRLEGSIWVVRDVKTRIEFRIPPGRRKDLRVLGGSVSTDGIPDAAEPPPPLPRTSQRIIKPPPRVHILQPVPLPNESSNTPLKHPASRIFLEDPQARRPTPPPRTVDLFQEDPRMLRRVIMSLKNGLSPPSQYLDGFAVANAGLMRNSGTFFRNVSEVGGDAMVIRGGYGHGKTFSLQTIEQLALSQGFCVAKTEIDASEIRLDRPHIIYRNLLSNFRVPALEAAGPRALGEQLHEYVRLHQPSRDGRSIERWLSERIQCRPLVWLLSDRKFLWKPGLMELLAGDPGPVGRRRAEHSQGSQPRDWPAFSAGTQGDFAAYLLSGLGRLARLMGHQGLILLFDEMEKWQDLSWQQQAKAGNLLGGLIWGATARPGHRHCRGNWAFAANDIEFRFRFSCAHERELAHSCRCNGYPFSTFDPCHLGIAIALTPRGASGPEHQWLRYGPLSILDLPSFGIQAVQSYFYHLVPIYQRAHNVPNAPPSSVLEQAMHQWQNSGDRTARSAVTSIITALDEWRAMYESPD
jgi:hypothetical protein